MNPRWGQGSRVGDYVLDAQLGAGGMGVVYRARHEATGAFYALKALHLVEPDELARFEREAEAMVIADGHPNVVRVHSSGVEGGCPYVVMELSSGGDLSTRLKSGCLAPHEAATLGRDLALGVAHLHSRGVLHRDLKPENVLFDEAGVPKLVDFGLARVSGREALTLSGEILGTPAYMSPEQARGERDRVNEAADVYGLGGLLYVSLTGSPPVEGASLFAILTAVLEEDPVPPSQLRGDGDRALDEIVLRALAKNPADRQPSALALADELERYLAGEGANPSPGKLAWIALGLLALLLIPLVIARGSLPESASPAPTRTSPPTSVSTPTRVRGDEPRFPSWHLLSSSNVAKREAHRLAYFPPAGRVLMYGGLGAGEDRGVVGEVALWNSERKDWEIQTSLVQAQPRANFGMAFDASRNAMVISGGSFAGSPPRRDTVDWTPKRGGCWDLRGPVAQLPKPKDQFQLAYDPGQGQTYAFGGDEPQLLLSTRLGWKALSPKGDAPSLRRQAAVAFDATRGRLIVFGGLGPGMPVMEVLGDLWEFDGKSWIHCYQNYRPSRRRAATLVDVGQGRVLLYGGVSEFSNIILADLWLWTGTQWREITLPSRPPARHDAGVAWDPQRQVLLVAGGRHKGDSLAGLLDDTWELRDLGPFLGPLTEHDPSTAQGWLVRATQELWGGEGSAAGKSCAEGIRALESGEDSTGAGLLLIRARCAALEKRWGGVIQDTTKALGLAPELFEAHRLRGSALSAQNELLPAYEDFQAYWRQNPDGVIRVEMLTLRYRLGERELAQEVQTILATLDERDVAHKRALSLREELSSGR